jgi:hypothetical protein
MGQASVQAGDSPARDGAGAMGEVRIQFAIPCIALTVYGAESPRMCVGVRTQERTRCPERATGRHQVKKKCVILLSVNSTGIT